MHPSDNITKENLEEIFTYHDDPEKVPKYVAIRHAAKQLAESILANAPYSADRKDAIRSVRMAVMQANAAIAVNNINK